MTLPVAGWYPDPSGEPVQRWWDGRSWTAQSYDPEQQSSGAVHPGTPVYNPWIWLLVATQLLPLFGLFFVDWDGLIRMAIADSMGPTPPLVEDRSPTEQLQAVLSVENVAQFVANLLTYLVGLLCAFLDWRTLRYVGFPRPFHWAWAFFPWTLVYVIGRSVAVKRAAGRGLAPIGWYVAMIVLSVIVIVAVFLFVLSIALSQVP